VSAPSPILIQVPVPSAFGTLCILWRETDGGPKVFRVLLPPEQASDAPLSTDVAPASQSPSSIADLAHRMQRFLKGEAVAFDLGLLALEQCSEFQRAVLLADSRIPRGWVSTYGSLARHVGVPGGARAVGGALSRNPFPILIPCHRAIRSDGHLGGFRGGLKMKQALLELEGMSVTQAGKVLAAKFYYE